MTARGSGAVPELLETVAGTCVVCGVLVIVGTLTMPEHYQDVVPAFTLRGLSLGGFFIAFGVLAFHIRTWRYEWDG